MQRSEFLDLLLQGRFPEFGLAFLDRVILSSRTVFRQMAAYFVMSTQNVEAESLREKARG